MEVVGVIQCLSGRCRHSEVWRDAGRPALARRAITASLELGHLAQTPCGSFLPAMARPQAWLLTHRPVVAWLQEQSDLIHQDKKGDLVEHRQVPLCFALEVGEERRPHADTGVGNFPTPHCPKQ